MSGVTSNPAIFEHAISDSNTYDADIQSKALEGKSGEALFFELAIKDLTEAADLFRRIHDASGGMDGWVSLEVSPLLAGDSTATTQAAVQLHARAQRPNLFIKIPGNGPGLVAIEAAIFAGVPVNVTLLFSREQYLAAARAYLRGIERRIAAGLDPRVMSVASVFVSRWDVAVRDKVSQPLQNILGIAIAMRTYKAYRDLLEEPQWQKLESAGAWPQRLLWASTAPKDKSVSDSLYIEALAAPDTINTIPEKTLLAFAASGIVSCVLSADTGHAEAIIAQFNHEDINDIKLATQLQREGIAAFARSWRALLACIARKSVPGAAPR